MPQTPTPANGEPDLTQPGNTKLTSVLDLVDARVHVTFPGQTQPQWLVNPFASEPQAMQSYMAVLLDRTTVSTAATIPGRININQAPRTVLLTIPTMTAEMADAIIQSRVPAATSQDTTHSHEAWPLMAGILTLDQMKAMLPFINAGGDVFRVHSVGYFDQGGQAARVEAILDASDEEVRVVFWRDLTNLGRGFSPLVLGTQATP